MRATVSFPYDIVHLPRHILYLEAMPEGSEHSYQNGFGGGLDRGDRGDRAGRGGTQTSAAAGDPIFDRVPPHDDDAEMAVLGGMLMSKDAIGEVSQTIDVTDFYQPSIRRSITRSSICFPPVSRWTWCSWPTSCWRMATSTRSAARTICTALSHPYRPPLMPCTTRRSSISGPFCAM